ncbi:hypothetical protein Tco_1581475, partial [Tanacetum coccineum]
MHTQATKGKRIKTLAKGDKPANTKSKGLTVLSESKVPDEQQQTGSGIDEGAGEDEEDDNENNNDEHESDDDNDHNDDEDDDQENDNERTVSDDDDGDDFVHLKLSTFNEDDQKEDKDKEKANDDEDENQDDDYVIGGEQEDEEIRELYGDLNINLNRSDAEMMDAQVTQKTGEVHVTLTTQPPIAQQQSSSVSSDLVSKFINPSPDTALSSIPGIDDKYLTSKMKDEVNVVVQLMSNKLREEAQA